MILTSFCGRTYKAKNGLTAHEEHCKICIEHTRSLEPKQDFHLKLEDCFAVSPDHAGIVTSKGSRGNAIRKAAQRFHRRCLMAHAARKAKLGKRHGWKPTNDVRHKTTQI